MVDGRTATPPDDAQVAELASSFISLMRSAMSVARKMRGGPSSLSTPFTILGAVCKSEEPARPADLAAAACVDASVTSRALAQLEADGLVVRHRDPDDQRRTYIEATDLGVRRLGERQQIAFDVLSAALAKLPDADLALAPQVLEALESAIQTIGADDVTGLPSLSPT